MKAIASSSLVDFTNQYPPLCGVPELRQAVARHSEKQQGLPVDWATETLITIGATEGLAACFLGLLNPGDEVGESWGGPTGPTVAFKHRHDHRSMAVMACSDCRFSIQGLET